MNPSESNNKPIALPSGPALGVGESTVIHSNFLVPAALGPTVDSTPHVPPGVNSSPTVGGLMQALRRRWPLALGLAVLAGALAVGAIMTIMPAKYPSQVRIQIVSRVDTPMFSGGNEDHDFLLYKKNMEAMLKSPQILYAALKQKTKNGKEVKDLEIIRDNGVDWLEVALKSDFLLGPEILKVVLNSDKADEGAELLNAIARAFVEVNNQKESDRNKNRIKEYQDNLARQKEELNKLHGQLRGLEKNLDIPNEKIHAIQFQATYQQQELAAKAVQQNKSDQIRALTSLTSEQETYAKIGDMKIPPEEVNEAFDKDSRAQEKLLELKNIDKEISVYKANGKESFIGPRIRILEESKQKVLDQMEDLKKQLTPEFEKVWRNKYANEVAKTIVALKNTLSTLEKQAPILKDDLSQFEQRTKLLGPNSQVPLNILNLQSEIKNLEDSRGDITRKIQNMQAEVVNPRVSVLQYAAEPKSKDYSRQVKLAGAGGFSIFLMVLFGVAFLEFRSRKISGQDEVSQGLGLNVVGSLPPLPSTIRKGGSDASSPKNVLWQNQLNEAIDGIRTMLLHSSRTENLRVIMVTSASGGEGKTSLATQLAASLARAWRKTLLIDGDLRKPAAHKVLNVPQEPGFSELLRDEVTANDAIKPTGLGRLWLMPAGHFDSHSVQALAQDTMRTLFEQLKQQYDFIIVDSSPVLPVADALVLGQHVDGVIFSILRDVSRMPAVHAAQQKVSNLGIRVLGAVMIGAPSETGNQRYAYAGGK